MIYSAAATLYFPHYMVHLVVPLEDLMCLFIIFLHSLFKDLESQNMLIAPGVNLLIEGDDVEGKLLANQLDVLYHVLSHTHELLSHVFLMGFSLILKGLESLFNMSS